MGQTQSDTLHVQWLDRTSGAVKLVAIPGVPLRKAGKSWRPISQKGPAVQWTFPEEENSLGLDGASLLAVSSFSQGRFGKYQRRLWKGFQRAKELGLPVVIDLRGNAVDSRPGWRCSGGMWRTAGANFRLAWWQNRVQKPGATSTGTTSDCEKVGRQAQGHLSRCAVHLRPRPSSNGGADTLEFGIQPLVDWRFQVPFACSWMVNRPRQPCRLRGHSNKDAADLCLGSRAWGPNKGPWATPCSRCCLNPES